MLTHPLPEGALPGALPTTGLPVSIRPLEAHDAERYLAFLLALTREDLYQRVMGAVQASKHTDVDRLLRIDDLREVALAARDDEDAILGVARAHIDLESGTAEFALIVHSSHKRRGLGRRLMCALLARLHARGVRHVVGQTFAGNVPLLHLVRTLGFVVGPGDDAATREVSLGLH